MHSDLEAIVAADEEARSRVALAEERRERELGAARAACDAATARRRAEVQAALDAELHAIEAAGDARLTELRARQEQYLAALREAGTRRFEEAVAAWLRIVAEVAP